MEVNIFSPEEAIDIQKSIGADIVMAFDECPPYPCDYSYAKNSMNLTHRWLDRCISRFDNTLINIIINKCFSLLFKEVHIRI